MKKLQYDNVIFITIFGLMKNEHTTNVMLSGLLGAGRIILQ